MKNKFLYGFTLGEVLLALLIVSVIASITIPSVVANYKKQIQVLALKKTFNDLNQNLEILKGENYLRKGLYNTILAKTPSKDADIENFFDKYYKNSQKCGNTAQPCFAPKYKSINGSILETFDNCSEIAYSVLLADGTAICIRPASVSYKQMISPTGNFAKEVKAPAVVYIDINGPEKPNIGGRDLFTFNIYEDFIIDEISPSAIENNTIITDREDLFNNNCLSSSIGTGCFAKILNDNWKMNY